MKFKCLSIAGFDGSGGAGLQADLKVFSALGCYGMNVLTALPIQNTCGVKKCYELPLESIHDQLEAIFEDIKPDAIKIGMLFTSQIIELVTGFLSRHARDIPIVLDPVMISKSGHSLLLDDAVESLRQSLIPISTIITPNLPESYHLIGKRCDMEEAAKMLMALGPKAVLLKGGHDANRDVSNDLFISNTQEILWLDARRIESKNTHGTGCTLSAAICAFLAHGVELFDACQYAKKYITDAIIASQYNSVGHGHGPVHHFYHIWPQININFFKW